MTFFIDGFSIPVPPPAPFVATMLPESFWDSVKPYETEKQHSSRLGLEHYSLAPPATTVALQVLNLGNIANTYWSWF